MATILVNHLRIRVGPSINAEIIGFYNSGQRINTLLELIENEGRTWLKYKDDNNQIRYVCVKDIGGENFVSLPCGFGGGCNCGRRDKRYIDIPGLPHQMVFPDLRIQKWGCLFLCICVKGGLTTVSQFMDCFNWGLNSGKLRSVDCYVTCNKENWAREISERYGTTYHGDYIFQKSIRPHFWLTQGDKEIFNSMGIGYH